MRIETGERERDRQRETRRERERELTSVVFSSGRAGGNGGYMLARGFASVFGVARASVFGVARASVCVSNC